MFKQTKVSIEIIEQIIFYYKRFSKKIPSPTISFLARKENTTVTVYTNQTVTFQGEHENSEAARFFSDFGSEKKQQQLFEHTSYPVIGSDESGAGDVFGPLVISAVLIENQEQYNALKTLGITDSKKLSDTQNLFLAERIHSLCQTKTIIFNNSRYNQLISKGINLNALKTAGHLQATKFLFEHTDLTIRRITVDQFTPEKTFWKYVQKDLKKPLPSFKSQYFFQTRAESDFLEVAAASIVARATFLQALEKLSDSISETLIKGAGIHVDIQIRELHKKGVNFDAIAKTHFANIKKQVSV